MFGIGGVELALLLPFIAVATVPYFIPTIVAAARRHSNLMMIGLINLLAGWTIVGWFVAFLWSLRDPNTRTSTTAP